MTDVLVAGGGPAGAIAALVLARAGVRVRIIDRARFPRDKLCGDTVNPGALAILSRLGLEQVVEGGLEIEGMLVTGDARVQVRATYGDRLSGRALSRRILDARLLEAAARAGVEVEEGVLAESPLLEADGTVRGLLLKSRSARARCLAPVTIAADGAQSRIARALRLTRTPSAPRRWAVGGLFHDVQGVSAVGEMHVRPDCYIGVAPLPGAVTNACVVSADRQFLKGRDVLLSVLRNDPATAPRFADATLLAPPVTMGPLATDAKAAGTPGLLLAGDAAGFIDPMTGDGLRFAFRGAELAAAAALRVLEDGWKEAHVRLAMDRAREFGPKWRFNRALRRVAASPFAVRAAAAGAQLSPALLRHAIRYAGDVGVAGG
jgi:flavin-dependent dehydrogenase